MSEFEFKRLLKSVSAAAQSGAQDNDTNLRHAPRPANDNQLAWSLVPFPAGWCASC